MKYVLLTLAVCLTIAANSQIIGPDTVCVGTTAQFSTPQEATSYTWVPDNNVNIIQPPSTQTVVATNALLGAMTYITLNNDNGHYYSFSTNYYQNKVIKIDYGNSPLNTPTITDMGSFGLNSGQTDGIDVAKDASGNWWGLIVGGTQMLRLNFGNSLANTPTSTLWTYPANLWWPHQAILKKDGNDWMAFVANRSGYVTRFDFGNSLNNTPTPTNIPYVGNYQYPGNIALYKQGGNWYMLVINLLLNTISRLDFGPSLLNNTPTGVDLGNPGGLLGLPRGTSFLTDCDQQLISYTLNEGGSMVRLDYQGNVTNLPTATNPTTFPSGSLYNSILPFTYNGVLYYLAPHTSGTIYRFSAINYTPQTVTNYYNPNFSYTFNTPGVYNLSLHCDQGFPQGPSAYCKQVVVVNSTGNVTLGNDTTICGTSYTLNSNVQGATSYLWNTGATTPSISVTSSGTYWVSVSGGCVNGSDTINLTLLPQPVVDLGPDTALCAGQSINLQSQGTFTTPAYLWSTGSTSPSINVNQTGTYWLQVSQGVCTDADSIQVIVQSPPIVDLGNDKLICPGAVLVLQSSNTYTNPTYTWNTGETTPTISITQPGTYWLSVSVAVGCEGSDTINISQGVSPVVAITDTAICPGTSAIVQAQGSFTNPSYLWSNGSTSSSTSLSQSGAYWVIVTDNGCPGSDTMLLSYLPEPVVNIYVTDSICPGTTVTLSSQQPDGSQYLWSNGSTGNSINAEAGEHWLLVTNIHGCKAGDTTSIFWLAPPSVVLGNDTSICEGNMIMLSPMSYSGTLEWDNDSTTTNINVSQEGIYYLTATNICGIAIDSIYVDVVNCNLWVPDAFTPNGDGKNDIFRVMGDFSLTTDFNFAVYDRWGERVFFTQDPLKGWDGTFRGNHQDVNTFGYMVKCKMEGKSVLLKGFFHLIR